MRNLPGRVGNIAEKTSAELIVHTLARHAVEGQPDKVILRPVIQLFAHPQQCA